MKSIRFTSFFPLRRVYAYMFLEMIGLHYLLQNELATEPIYCVAESIALFHLLLLNTVRSHDATVEFYLLKWKSRDVFKTKFDW